MPYLDELSAITAITDDDLLLVMNDPASAKATRKITIGNMAATTGQKGFVELATTVEAAAGVDTSRAVTPAGVAAYHQQPITIGIAGSVEGDVTLAALGAQNWHIALGQATWFTHPNDVLMLGYNRTGIGSWDNSAIPSIGMVFEADYYSTAVEHWCEWYVEFRSGAGVVRRPFQSSIKINDNTIINYINGATTFYNSAGSLMMQTEESVSQISFYGPAVRGMINNAYLLSQWNAANSQFYHIWLNSANQWAIDAEVTMYADIRFNHSTNHGPVLIDRATAAQRRIICTNGVLSTEAA